jgi:hypothetical protein
LSKSRPICVATASHSSHCGHVAPAPAPAPRPATVARSPSPSSSSSRHNSRCDVTGRLVVHTMVLIGGAICCAAAPAPPRRPPAGARRGRSGRTELHGPADSQCCLLACGRLAAPSPWRPPSAGAPCSTRLVDHTGRAARGPGPVTVAACRGRRGRACSPYTARRRCLPETSSPRLQLLASPSGAGMALGAPLPPLTGSLGDRRSGLTVARPLQPVFAGSGRFWGLCKEQPKLWR